MMNASNLKGELVGVVVDNNDPLNLQRLKIRLIEWHDDVPDELLPWFVPEKLDSWGSTPEGGSFGPPLIGSYMWVKFHNGDPHSPVYMGYVRDKDRIVPQSVPDYPHRVGFATGSNDYFYLNRQNGDTTFSHRTGTNWFITGASGRLTVNLNEKYIATIASDSTITNGGNITVNNTGTVGVTSGGNITFTCPTYHMICNAHVSQTLTVDASVNVGANVNVTGNVGCATLNCNLLIAANSAMDAGTY